LQKVCKDVAVEPTLQRLTGEELPVKVQEFIMCFEGGTRQGVLGLVRKSTYIRVPKVLI